MPLPSLNPRASAFTLVEVLVSIVVLALLVAMIGSLFNNTTTASSISTNHLEADARVRLLFGRMATDFSHMMKRADVDYYLKSPSYSAWAYPPTPYVTSANLQTGPANDQMAFFSEVSGYSSASDAQNSISLVAYRVNNTGSAPCVERLGKALSWGGSSTAILPLPFLPMTIAANWPAVTLSPSSSATTDSAYDQDFETLVPNAFRFEYYYLLTNGTLSATPWDTTTTPPHSALNGLQDVAGIGVVVAVTDRKASPLATTAQLKTLAGQMADFTAGATFGQTQTNWQATVTASTLPPVVKNGIRIYEQLFNINTPSQ
jgi:hypothetical protein